MKSSTVVKLETAFNIISLNSGSIVEVLIELVKVFLILFKPSVDSIDCFNIAIVLGAKLNGA